MNDPIPPSFHGSFQPADGAPPEQQERIKAVMERMLRVFPELIRYAWRGEGIHHPFPEHAVLGLTKVHVEWTKVSPKLGGEDGLVEAAWFSDKELMEAHAKARGATDEQIKQVAASAQPYTTLMVRYWTEGIEGARYVVYKMMVGGAGNDDGSVAKPVTEH